MNLLRVDVLIDVQGYETPDAGLFETWANAAYLRDGPAEVSIKVVDAAESAALNAAYRQKSGPTNVLSFPMDFAPPDPAGTVLLGDIALCAPVILDEATGQNKPPVAHWAHMTVHGMLHLQGYDHIQAPDAARMERLEVDILARLGYKSPYEND